MRFSAKIAYSCRACGPPVQWCRFIEGVMLVKVAGTSCTVHVHYCTCRGNILKTQNVFAHNWFCASGWTASLVRLAFVPTIRLCSKATLKTPLFCSCFTPIRRPKLQSSTLQALGTRDLLLFLSSTLLTESIANHCGYPVFDHIEAFSLQTDSGSLYSVPCTCTC